MTAPDISPEAVESFCNDLADVADRMDDAGRTGSARAVTDAQALLRALRSALTAAEKLLQEVHLSHNEEWLYAEDTEHSWAQRRDRFLEGLKNG